MTPNQSTHTVICRATTSKASFSDPVSDLFSQRERETFEIFKNFDGFLQCSKDIKTHSNVFMLSIQAEFENGTVQFVTRKKKIYKYISFRKVTFFFLLKRDLMLNKMRLCNEEEKLTNTLSSLDQRVENKKLIFTSRQKFIGRMTLHLAKTSPIAY